MSSEECSPAEYYESVSSQLETPPSTREEWQQLIWSLRTLLQSTHTIIPYTSTSTDVWDALGVLDADPHNATRVVEIYSNRTEPWSTNGLSTGWNREHLLCRSYGLFDSGPDYSDLFNLRPADANVNSARNNLYYDECIHAIDPSCTTPAHSEAASDTAKNWLKFMPSMTEKGDIARSVFYMALRYNGTEANTVDLTLTDCPCVATHAFGNLTTLLQWNELDPVTESEMLRNNMTCSLYQTNRNPFIDYPWLSDMFTVRPFIDEVATGCIGNYTGDPDDCIEGLSPTPYPTVAPTPAEPTLPTTPQPTINTVLDMGQVEVIGVNTDDPDSFALVVLEEISTGTKIFVTDDAWTGTDFRGSEGILAFTVTSTIPAGATISYSSTSSYGAWTTEKSGFALSTSGDQILVYAGSTVSPVFLFALSNNGWADVTDPLSSTTSVLPASLEATNSYVTLPSIDNCRYNGVTVGTLATLQNQIHLTSNWICDDSVRYSMEFDSFTVIEPTLAPSFNPKSNGNDSDDNALEDGGVVALICAGSILLLMLGAFFALYMKNCRKNIPAKRQTSTVELENTIHPFNSK